MPPNHFFDERGYHPAGCGERPSDLPSSVDPFVKSRRPQPDAANEKPHVCYGPSDINVQRKEQLLFMSFSRWAAAPIRYALSALLPPTVRGPMTFEARSFVGRLFARRLRLNPNNRNYMNLGSAEDRIADFIAVDFFAPNVGYGADLRYPLLIDDAVFDGIFTEHTLEHLNYADVTKILAECERTLKPGGIIRIIVPDLSIFVENYATGNEAWFRDWEREVLKPRGRSMSSRMEAFSFVTQEYGHRSAWDFETMKNLLARAGFTDIRRSAYRDGSDPRLLQDKDDRDRTMSSLYVEARKVFGTPAVGG